MRQQLKIQAGSIAPPMSIEEVKAMLDTTEKGGVRNSIKNCLTVFQHDPLLSGAIAYNLLTDRTDVVKPIGYDRSPSASMTDTDMKYIRLYLEENYDLTSEKKIIDAADLAAHQNSYHPVRDFLNSLTWDGTERIRYCLHHFLGAEADEYTFQALRLFLLGAIHRAFHPGKNLRLCSVWWAVRARENPHSSGCWQARMSGFPTICGSWTMKMYTASCKVTGSSKCPR